MYKDIYDRTFRFAINTIKFTSCLNKTISTSILTNQIIRSACSIGANLREAKQARTKKEFISSFGIALKETEETIYWLEIIKELELTSADECDKLILESKEISKILATIILKSKK